MWRLPFLILCGVFAFAKTTLADDSKPGAMFVARCANCHAVPDPALAADRAWLDQIRRTS